MTESFKVPKIREAKTREVLPYTACRPATTLVGRCRSPS